MVAWLPNVRYIFGVLSLYLTCALAFPQVTASGPAIAAEAGSQLIARQSGLSWTITPLIGMESPSAFYAYVDFQSKNPLVQPKTSLIFFYGDAQEGALSLFIIHGAPPLGVVESTASFEFSGLPATALTLVKDDPDDYYSLTPPEGKIEWRWSAGLTDGVIIGGLTGEFTLTIYPQFGTGITHWVLVTGDLQNPQYIELPNLSGPLILQARLPDPVASFHYQPTEPPAGEPVSFDASASRSSAGPIVHYSWYFDGAFTLRSALPLTAYAFERPGDHDVTLKVEDPLGRVATETRTVHVRDDPVRVTRKIKTFLPNSQALPGYLFSVELLVEADAPINGLGIEETPPAGWRIQPLDNGGAQFNATTSAWLYLGTISVGGQLRITYQIAVPKPQELGVYRFAGRALSGSPQVIVAIGGDSEMSVIGALPVELAISRLNDQGEIDLTLSNSISFAQIQQAVALWLREEPVPGTNGRLIDLGTMVRLVAYWLTDTPVDQPLPAG